MKRSFSSRRFASYILAVLAIVPATILANIPTANAATPVQLLRVTSSTGPQTWVVYNNQTTHWLTPDCASQLTARNLPVVNGDWGRLSNYRRVNPLLCINIVSAHARALQGNGQASQNLVLMQTGQSPGEGWVRLLDGGRQWVDASCMQTLRNRGISTEIRRWIDISRLPVRNPRRCEDLVRLLSGPGTPRPPASNQAGNQTNSQTSTQPNTQSSTGVRPPSANFSRTCIGMNDDFAHSWDGGSLVADAFKQAKGPVLNDYRTLSPVDSDGWPAGFQTVNFVLGEGDHDLEESSAWVLLPYDQSGVWLSGPARNTWTMEGARHAGVVDYNGVVGHRFFLTDAHINLKITAGSIPSPGRNRWHMVPDSMASRYASAMRENGFRYIFSDDRYLKDLSFPLLHPNARRQMADFCRIRFMLGDSINSLNFTGYNRDRSRTANPTFRTPNGDGIPYEWEVWIANHLGKNIWHVDHVKTWDAWAAGDGYLREQASYFARHLRGNVIREYANEIWNLAGAFVAQTKWATTRTPYAGSNQAGWKLVNNRYGKRAWDTAGPWAQAFSSRRGDLDNTVGIHTGCPPCVEHRLTSPDGQSFGDRMDSISGTFYLGELLATRNAPYNVVANRGFSGVDELHRKSLESLKRQLTEIMDGARPHVSRWHMYEGGSHMNFPSFSKFNAEHVRVNNVIEQYWKSASFTRVLSDFKNWWDRQNGAGELMWFNLYGLDNPDNPFGYYVGSNSAQARHAGIGNFIRANR